MPKVLNVDKLEKKFSSVTKSKDSIQSLSLWILYHKHFHDEICRHWLTALEKSNSGHRLTLFYVANDVLQHCKKKNAVEYRVAFAEVLEDAVLLAKEDIIRDEILRMINIWNERNVYSSDYLLQLTEILNDKSASGTSKTDSDKNEESQEAETSSEEDEAKILAEFKTTNLIACLQELIDLKKQVSMREKELEPYDDIIATPMKALNKRVSSDTKKRYEKIDKASKLMESYLISMDKETAGRKQAVKLLGHSRVFYSTQNDEVRRVVHAYRLFGKKLKLVQQKLNEKMSTFPEPVKIEKSPSPIPTESSLPSSAPSAVDSINVEILPASSPEVIATSSPLSNFTSTVLDSPAKSQASSATSQDNHSLECVQSGSSLDERLSFLNKNAIDAQPSLDSTPKISASPAKSEVSCSSSQDSCSLERVQSRSGSDERLSFLNQKVIGAQSSLKNAPKDILHGQPSSEQIEVLDSPVKSQVSCTTSQDNHSLECVQSRFSLDERLSFFDQKAIGAQSSLKNPPKDILQGQQSSEPIEVLSSPEKSQVSCSTSQDSPNLESAQSGSSLDERLSFFNQKAIGCQFSAEIVPKDFLNVQQSTEQIESDICDNQMDESNHQEPKIEAVECDPHQTHKESVVMECISIEDEQKKICEETKSSEQTADDPPCSIHHKIKQKKSMQQVDDDSKTHECTLTENQNMAALEIQSPVVIGTKLNGDAKIQSKPPHKELPSVGSRPLVVSSSDPLQYINKLCHPSNTRNDCTKTTFTCLENPECSISEAPKNSQNMLCLLESMKLLQRLIPKQSGDTTETYNSSNHVLGEDGTMFPLSAIFKILSCGIKSNIQVDGSTKETTVSSLGNELSVVKNETVIAEAKTEVEEDDLMPMDMDLDSDEDF